MNPTPIHSFKWSENEYFHPRFDAVGHRLWTALAPKVTKVCIWFWCMLMLGLGPTWLRLNPNHIPLLKPLEHPDIAAIRGSITSSIHQSMTKNSSLTAWVVPLCFVHGCVQLCGSGRFVMIGHDYVQMQCTTSGICIHIQKYIDKWIGPHLHVVSASWHTLKLIVYPQEVIQGDTVYWLVSLAISYAKASWVCLFFVNDM